MSMSGMPNNACHFLGTTMNVYIICLIWCSIFTFHFPYCVIVLLFVFNWMFLFLVATSCSFVDLGNNLLYKYKGIMFPSLPVCMLYCTIIETWFDDLLYLLLLPTAYC